MNQKIPTLDECEDFRNRVFLLRNVFLPFTVNNNSNLDNIPYDEQSAELLKHHQIYKWLNKNNDFNLAYEGFQRKKAFKECLKKNAADLAELEFMAICSIHIITYLYKKNNDLIPNAVTKPKREKTLKAATQLKELFDSGITLMDQSDNNKFISLVSNLIYELEHHAPTLSPLAKSGYLLEREFVHKISLSFQQYYKDYCANVTKHLIKVISDLTISNDTIENWIDDVKKYLKKRHVHYLIKGLRNKMGN